LFTAHAAQHLAASAEVLLRQAKSWPPEEVSRYLGNLKLLEQSLRVLRGRRYGDKRLDNKLCGRFRPVQLG
jgi:hypothetical protein